MTKPRFEDFRYRGVDIDGNRIDEDAPWRSAHQRIRTDALSADGQSLAVFTTTPQNLTYPEVIVRSTAFSDDNGRPESALFDAYVAEATGRRVMAVNTPGVDYFTDDQDIKQLGRLTPEQHEELRMYGSFRKVGESSMRAIHTAAIADGELNPQFIISGSSMGVALTGGMIREAFNNNIDVAGIVLAEPVNHVSRPLGKLGLQFMMTNGVAPSYLETNPQPVIDAGESMGFWLRRTMEGGKANWAYARALGAGMLLADLGSDAIEAMADLKTPSYMTRGSASSLSSDKSGQDFNAMLDHFSPVDTLESDIFEGHDHPYTMTVQSVIDGVARVTPS